MKSDAYLFTCIKGAVWCKTVKREKKNYSSTNKIKKWVGHILMLRWHEIIAGSFNHIHERSCTQNCINGSY